jgi:hypothetical protein
MAFLAGALALGGLVLSGAGISEQAKAGRRAAKESQQIARENARIARENAVIAAQKAELQVKGLTRQAFERFGTQKAIIGASGVTRAGSPEDVIREGFISTAEDIMTTRMLGAEAGREFLQRGREFGAQARQFGAQARATRRLAPFQIGATLLTGGASILESLPQKTITRI